MSTVLSQLRARLAELTDIDVAARVLNWDQQTNMPPGGAEARAEVMATLERLSHELFIAPETGRLLEGAALELERGGADPDGDEARLVSVATRDWEKARRVPTSLAGAMAHASSLGEEAWIAARQSADFTIFKPYLERHLELKHRYVECFEGLGYECAYDVVLDDFEAGMRTREVAALFAELRSELVPLIAAVAGRAAEVDDACLHGNFKVADQRRVVLAVLERMGWNSAAWRLDDAVHPFAVGVANRDVRLTTRWDEAYWPSGLYAAMHECGHGLYEAGIADALQRTPLGSATALGLHESQSRMWENMVGRGGDFARFLAPLISAAFDRPVEPPELYRAVNRVTPSFIRVEADEATYGLHVILRFELEQELIEGSSGRPGPAGGLEPALRRALLPDRSERHAGSAPRTCTGPPG